MVPLVTLSGGRVVRWLACVGDYLLKDDPVVVLEAPDGYEVQVCALEEGRLVRRCVPRDAPVGPYATLGFLSLAVAAPDGQRVAPLDAPPDSLLSDVVAFAGLDLAALPVGSQRHMITATAYQVVLLRDFLGDYLHAEGIAASQADVSRMMLDWLFSLPLGELRSRLAFSQRRHQRGAVKLRAA